MAIMEIKRIINLQMEKLTKDEVEVSKKIKNLLGGCGISNGWGECGIPGR